MYINRKNNLKNHNNAKYMQYKSIQTIVYKYKNPIAAFIFGLVLLGACGVSPIFAAAPTGQRELTQEQERVQTATQDLEDKTLQELVVDFFNLLRKYVLNFLLALTILVFLYGLMKYMFKGQSSETARAEGKQIMLWGIIGLFVITSIWGLVGIFASIVGHKDIVIPQF